MSLAVLKFTKSCARASIGIGKRVIGPRVFGGAAVPCGMETQQVLQHSHDPEHTNSAAIEVSVRSGLDVSLLLDF